MARKSRERRAIGLQETIAIVAGLAVVFFSLWAPTYALWVQMLYKCLLGVMAALVVPVSWRLYSLWYSRSNHYHTSKATWVTLRIWNSAKWGLIVWSTVGLSFYYLGFSAQVQSQLACIRDYEAAHPGSDKTEFTVTCGAKYGLQNPVVRYSPAQQRIEPAKAASAKNTPKAIAESAAAPVAIPTPAAQSVARLGASDGAIELSASASPGAQMAASGDAAAVPPTQGPSFNCAKARSIAEHLICSDTALSGMDRDLFVTYTRAKAVAPDPAAFKRETATEWTWRERNCIDKPCITAWYQRREERLRSYLANNASTVP